MFNVIAKACNFMGMSNTDYIMMKSNEPKLKNIDELNKNQYGDISVNNIDIELVDLFIKESGWSNRTLSSLMSKKVFYMLGLVTLN